MNDVTRLRKPLFFNIVARIGGQLVIRRIQLRPCCRALSGPWLLTGRKSGKIIYVETSALWTNYVINFGCKWRKAVLVE